jgi:hypothetical protein
MRMVDRSAAMHKHTADPRRRRPAPDQRRLQCRRARVRLRGRRAIDRHVRWPRGRPRRWPARDPDARRRRHVPGGRPVRPAMAVCENSQGQARRRRRPVSRGHRSLDAVRACRSCSRLSPGAAAVAEPGRGRRVPLTCPDSNGPRPEPGRHCPEGGRATRGNAGRGPRSRRARTAPPGEAVGLDLAGVVDCNAIAEAAEMLESRPQKRRCRGLRAFVFRRVKYRASYAMRCLRLLPRPRQS